MITRKISKKDYGKKWPLTVDDDTLCNDDGAVYFMWKNGEKYRLNGLSKRIEGTQEITPIHKKDKVVNGIQLYKNISILISDGNLLK